MVRKEKKNLREALLRVAPLSGIHSPSSSMHRMLNTMQLPMALGQTRPCLSLSLLKLTQKCLNMKGYTGVVLYKNYVIDFIKEFVRICLTGLYTRKCYGF